MNAEPKHSQKDAIVEEWAMGPGVFRICPSCRNWFALRLDRVVPHPVFQEVRTYRCKVCGKSREFIESRPIRTL